MSTRASGWRTAVALLAACASFAPTGPARADDERARPYASALDERLVCESRDAREQYCAAPIGGSVRVIRELSRAPCVEGDTWRWTPRGIYVRGGCRAEFAFRGPDGWSGGAGGAWGGGSSGGAGWGGSPGGGWGGGGRYAELICASRGDRENFCPAPNDGRVRLVREQGGGDCVEGATWRAEPRGIRVRGGCVGRFGYFRISGDDGWGGGGGWGPPPVESFEVRCESRSHRWRTCPVDIVGPVQLVRQDSHAPCVRGWTWGTISREAIWVSDGCRGRFLVNGRASGRSGAEGSGEVPPGVRRASPPPGAEPSGTRLQPGDPPRARFESAAPAVAQPAEPSADRDDERRSRGAVPQTEGAIREP
jgi:hypothetical protein